MQASKREFQKTPEGTSYKAVENVMCKDYDKENKYGVFDRYTITVDPEWVKEWNNPEDVEIVCLTNWATTHKNRLIPCISDTTAPKMDGPAFSRMHWNFWMRRMNGTSTVKRECSTAFLPEE